MTLSMVLREALMDRDISNAARRRALARFGQRLQQARAAIPGLTQEAVAERLRVSRQTVQNWEVGRTEPSASTKAALAEIYDVNVDWLTEPEEALEIDDPDLSLFLRGEWKEFTEEEQEFFKGLIRESRDLLRKRREKEEQ